MLGDLRKRIVLIDDHLVMRQGLERLLNAGREFVVCEEASNAAEGCRQALAAARRMAENLDEMNRGLAHDLPTPLRIGVGINVGTVIVGEMGFARATSVTAIGDPVNTASRLETLTKDFACQLIVAEAVADKAGIDLAAFPRHEIEVRGRVGLMAIRVIEDARALPLDGAAPQPETLARTAGEGGARPAGAGG